MRPSPSSWPSAPGRLAAVLAAGATLAASPGAAGAQLFGLPAVQSPFGGRPFAIALDGGSASDGVRVGGVAISARRPGGRLLASLGVGRARGFEAARTTYGGRLAFLLRFGETGALAVAPFGGYGRVQGGDSVRVAATGTPGLARSLAIVPVGAGIGYARAVAGRAVAVHVTPQAQWWRRGAAGTLESEATWYGRAAVGADVAVTSQIGLSLAYEAGASAAAITDGPRKGVFGVALSYAPGRGRR